MDPSEKPEAVVPSELRRGRFSAPNALIASLLGRRSYFRIERRRAASSKSLARRSMDAMVTN